MLATALSEKKRHGHKGQNSECTQRSSVRLRRKGVQVMQNIVVIVIVGAHSPRLEQTNNVLY
jgi:hypothetical protein